MDGKLFSPWFQCASQHCVHRASCWRHCWSEPDLINTCDCCSHLSCQWKPNVPLPSENRSQMLVAFQSVWRTVGDRLLDFLWTRDKFAFLCCVIFDVTNAAGRRAQWRHHEDNDMLLFHIYLLLQSLIQTHCWLSNFWTQTDGNYLLAQLSNFSEAHSTTANLCRVPRTTTEQLC